MKQILLFFLIIIFISIDANSSVPGIKSIRTTTYQAIKKDTSWTTGAVIARINYTKFMPDGREISENILNADGSIYRKKIYLYNDQKQLVSVKTYDEFAKLMQSDSLMYDAKDRLIYRVAYNKMGIKQNDINYEYDAKGRLVTELHNSALGISRRVNLKYDGQDRKYETYYIDNSGRVRNAEVYSYDESDHLVKTERYDSKHPLGRRKLHEYVYDIHGQWITKVEFTNDEPEYIIKREIVYDLNNLAWDEMNLLGKVRSVKQASFYAIQKGTDIERGKPHGEFADILFDKEGRISSYQTYTEEGRPLNKILLEYGPDGQLTKKSERTSDGKLLKYSNYTYGDYNQLKKQFVYNDKDSVINAVVYVYDAEGNLKEERWLNTDSSLLFKYAYEVDAYGRVIGKKTPFYSNDQSLFFSEQYEYNFQNRIKEKKLYLPSGAVKDTFKYTYGKSGQVISGEDISAEGVKTVYNYKFYNDERGNWKKRVKFVDDKAVLYEERVYTYYE